MKRILAAVMICASLGGCISVDNYPENWAAPRIEQQSGCDDIVGRYRDVGETADPAGKRNASLARLLLAPGFGRTAADLVEVSYAENTLTLRVLRGGVAVAERDYSVEAGNLSCNAGDATIDPQFGLLGPAENIAMVGVGDSNTQLRRAADNSLIVRSSGQVVALVFLFPVVAGETRLYRFAAAE